MIRDAQSNDLPEIVNIHSRMFENFFMTKLGKDFLLLYYELVLKFDKGILRVYEEEGKIIGFVVGFKDPKHFYSTMKKNKIRFLKVLIKSIARRPELILQVLYAIKRTLKAARSIQNDEYIEYSDLRNAIELSSIAVIKPGIGTKLLLDFINISRKKNGTMIMLTTDMYNNEKVNYFYQKNGFVLAKTLSDYNGRKKNLYIYNL